MVCQFVRRPADQFAVCGEAIRVFRGQGDAHTGLRHGMTDGAEGQSGSVVTSDYGSILTLFLLRALGEA